MRIRETCMFCQSEIMRNWFTGEYVNRAGNAICVVVVIDDRAGELRWVGHEVDSGSHAHLDPTAV